MRILGITTLIFATSCLEPGKASIIEEGTLTEEQIQALEDDCESGNEEACDELEALEEDAPEIVEEEQEEEEVEESDPSEWESWEDVNTEDPEELIEWIEETIDECEDGNWEACDDLEELQEVIEEFDSQIIDIGIYNF